MLRFLFLLLILLTTSCKNLTNDGCINPDDAPSTGNIGAGNGIASLLISSVTSKIFGISGISAYSQLADPNSQYGGSIIFKMYNAIVKDIRFQAVVFLAIIFYISLMGASFLIGSEALTLKEMAKQIFKISFIVMFLTSTGWEFYRMFIIVPVLTSASYIGSKFVSSIGGGDYSSPFALIDYALSYVLSVQTLQKTIALLFGGYYGILYLIVVVLAIFSFLLMFIKGIFLYLATIIVAGFLFCSGPIFIALYLFDKTDGFFKKWVGALIGVFFQQVVLFVTMTLICHIGYAFLKGVFWYKVCWSDVISGSIKIPMPTIIKDIIETFLFMFNVSLPDYIVDIQFPLFSFFTIVTSPLNPPPDFFGAIGTLIIFSKLSQEILQKAYEFGGKLSKYSLDASKSGLVRKGLDNLSLLQTKASEAAQGAAKSTTGRFYNNTIGRVTGAKQQQDAKRRQELAALKEKINNGTATFGEKIEYGSKSVFGGLANTLTGSNAFFNSGFDKALDKIGTGGNRAAQAQAIEDNMKIVNNLENRVNHWVRQGFNADEAYVKAGQDVVRELQERGRALDKDGYLTKDKLTTEGAERWLDYAIQNREELSKTTLKSKSSLSKDGNYITNKTSHLLGNLQDYRDQDKKKQALSKFSEEEGLASKMITDERPQIKMPDSRQINNIDNIRKDSKDILKDNPNVNDANNNPFAQKARDFKTSSNPFSKNNTGSQNQQQAEQGREPTNTQAGAQPAPNTQDVSRQPSAPLKNNPSTVSNNSQVNTVEKDALSNHDERKKASSLPNKISGDTGDVDED